MVSYNRILINSMERQCLYLEVFNGNYELDFVTKCYLKNEREAKADD